MLTDVYCAFSNDGSSDSLAPPCIMRRSTELTSAGVARRVKLSDLAKRRSMRLSNDDTVVLDAILHRTSVSLISDPDIQKLFKSYSLDDLSSADSCFTTSTTGSLSRSQLGSWVSLISFSLTTILIWWS